MLELTGTIKGQTFNEQLISADEAIKLFDIKFPKDTTIIRYSLLKASGTVRTNKADGKPTYAGNHLLTTFINGFMNGQNIQFRYYNSKIPQGVGNPPKYVPKKIEFSGKTQAFSFDRQKEQAVFTYLFTWCSQSPLRDPSSEQVYTLRDLSKENASVLQKQELLQEVRTAIFSLPDNMTIAIARGFKSGAVTISEEMLSNAVSARVALLKIAETHLPEVHNALNSKTVLIKGTITNAIKKGYLVAKDGQSGSIIWYYADQFGGEEICHVLPRHNPTEVLINHMMVSDNWLNFQNKAGEEEALVATLENEKVGLDLNDDDVVIQSAINQGMIVLHPTEKKIYIMEKNNFLSDRALLGIKDRDNWKVELKERASKPIMGRIKKRLKDK